MDLHPHRSLFLAALALPFARARAARTDDVELVVNYLPALAFVAFVAVVAILVYSMRLRDKRSAPLQRIFAEGRAVHAVGPDTPVMECARKMTAEKVGALVVTDGERLTGIFTERDALNKVLAAGRDPARTRVCEVMTKDPFCVAPSLTVGAAMQLVTQRRFRHLPVVQEGRLLAVVSSGDLTHWMVKDEMGEVRELVDLAARS